MNTLFGYSFLFTADIFITIISMELVVVNGANNISKSIIRSLVSRGKYNRVRLIDYRPFRSSVYKF